MLISLFTRPTLCSKSAIFREAWHIVNLQRLVTFESLELEKSYIHHLKALMCGINASRGQGHGCRFTMCHASLKMALLLHKEGLVKTTVPITVYSEKNDFTVASDLVRSLDPFMNVVHTSLR